MQFPITYTWQQLAELPGAAEHFSWDNSMVDEDMPDLAEFISIYQSEVSQQLKMYLTNIGYELTEEGITIRNLSAVYMANAIFGQVMFEYDASPEEVTPVHHARFDIKRLTTPTWALFNLGGDDDVDYNGSQPSCLSELLLSVLNKED